MALLVYQQIAILAGLDSADGIAVFNAEVVPRSLALVGLLPQLLRRV